jgi:drug/metabolite transporter (DMT)-like permease
MPEPESLGSKPPGDPTPPAAPPSTGTDRLASLPRRLAAVPPVVQGLALMTGATLGFSIMAGLIRFASHELDPPQIVFFRNLFALAFMVPWLMQAGFGGLRTERLGLHLGRAALGLGAMSCWFAAVALLPLAQAVALNFTVPLFGTILAVLILGEVVRLRRWSATLIGFLGVLVIVRPGFESVSPATALPILAAMFMASAAICVKSLSRTENPSAMVFYMNLFLTPMSLLPALWVWRWPGWETLLALIAIGLLAAGAHQLMTRAFAKADASAVMPLQYLRLPFTALIGFVVFSEVPDVWTFIGAAIIAASAIYIAQREARAARAPAHPDDAARA